MAKDIPSKKYKGVYYRILKDGDRSYFLILRINGKQKRISIGKRSEGITEAFCYQQKVNIINSERFGGEQAEILQRKKKSDPTFRELFDYFMKHGPLKESSKKVVQYVINQVPFADYRRITTDDVLKWQKHLKESGLSPNTVDNKINSVSSVFKFSISVGKYRHENPCEKVPRANADDKRLRYLSREEVEQLLDALFNKGVTDSRDRVVIHTLRHTTASLLVQNGTPLQVVQKVLDHETIRSTERYAKLHQDNIKSELHRLWQ